MANPFKPLDAKEVARRQAESQEIADRIKAVAEVGRSLLEHEEYELYRQKFTEMREVIIKQLAQDAEPDPVKFAFKAKVLLAKIDTLSMLLEAPKADIDKLRTLK